MASLVDKSLIQEREQSDGEPRYSLLETIREYGLDRLGASGEEADVRRHHAAYYLALAEQADVGLHGAEQHSWTARLETEHDNMREALRWSQATEGESERGLRLASALAGFWEVRGHLTEGRRWLETALAQSEKASPEVQARAMTGTAMVAYRQGDLGRSRELLGGGCQRVSGVG